jgi:hypothetical protein
MEYGASRHEGTSACTNESTGWLSKGVLCRVKHKREPLENRVFVHRLFPLCRGEDALQSGLIFRELSPYYPMIEYGTGMLRRTAHRPSSSPLRIHHFHPHFIIFLLSFFCLYSVLLSSIHAVIIQLACYYLQV